MKIATWNVNSVKARLPQVLAWLREAAPDVALLQEIKVTADHFPSMEIGDLGYNVAICGQRTYNGVAILAKRPIDVLFDSLPDNDADPQARYIEAIVDGLRVASIYAPNGNPIGTEKFAYKLGWLACLGRHVTALRASEDAFVLGGDFNVAPCDDDVYDPVGWQDDALCRPESRAAFRRLMHQGLVDALGATGSHHRRRYTWWDYRGGAWPADHGLRIDHLLLSPEAADRLVDADVDRGPRDWEKASDHAPVWCILDDGASQAKR
jgi:exodeoxyribonuclease-3